jgi:predicted MPP superfamily phosphohydrolase
MSGGRFAIFITVVLTIWALMHAYVVWRIGSIPWVAVRCSTKWLLLCAFFLWMTYPLARFLNAWNLEAVGAPLEFVAAIWIGVLFLLFAALFAVDFLTLGGWLFAPSVPHLHAGAAIIAVVLSLIALAQGLRSPVIREMEVTLPGLPVERDGLALVAISDLHLGTLKGIRWLENLLRRIDSLKPDLVVVVGDLVDGSVRNVETFLPVLKQLRAPFGVWAVTGNHEYYAGAEPSVKLMDSAGYQLLRDRSAEVAPGLVIAGVDDLTAREQFGEGNGAVAKALANRPAGATILLSHSPLETDQAAAAGANLMLSGHTHAGQIWPFSYLVGLKYPHLAGHYKIGDMDLIVCRGTSTWGPPMRLWHPCELLHIKLRSASTTNRQ